MKALFSPGRAGCMTGVLNTLLAIALTVVSFRYVQPKNCYRDCGAAERLPCLAGGCHIGEQKAGWPLPAFVDYPGGGSPTSGWGILGPEDLPLPVPLIFDVLFYSALLWLAFYIMQLIRSQAFPLKLIVASLPLNIFLAACLWFFYMLFGYYTPIGRGHGVQIYVDTSGVVNTVMGFSPTVSIPLDELIENYGEPDDVWLTSVGTAQAPKTWMALYWSSASMFVTLPEVANKTYVVRKRTNIEMIIFFNEQDVLRIDGKPLGEEKIVWTGYGNYVP